MAQPSDFDQYDISADLKKAFAFVQTQLENENTWVLDQFNDRKVEIDKLRAEIGGLVQERRNLKAKYDNNLAAIQELHAKLPPLPEPTP